MNNIYGNRAVSGDDFYGRDEFVSHLKEILLSKNSFLLLGLRRTGKSSVLKEAVRLLKEDKTEVVVVELNCQTYESIQDFYKNLYLALPKTWKESMRDFLKSTKRIPSKLIDIVTDHVEEVDISNVVNLKLRNEVISYANPIKEELTNFFQKQESHIVLVIDELPFLFENITSKNTDTTKLEIEMVLTTLRSWRDIGISQALCGSINLHTQLDVLGISKKLLGGLNTQTLPKYTDSEARGLLTKLANFNKLHLSEEHLNRVLELHPDFIPQFLQYFFFILNTQWDGSIENIDIVYKKYVYPTIVKDFEYQFEERYTNLSDDILILTKKILNKVYENSEVYEIDLLEIEDKEQNIHAALLHLAAQEFIVKDYDERYNFSFEIVKNWWGKKKR